MELLPQKKFEDSPELDPTPLVDKIGLLLGGEFTLEYVDGTYEIDSDSLRLSFVLEGDILEIRNIEVTENGLGSKVLSQTHQFADKNRLTVMASNVKDTARGFWERMGYQEGTTQGEFVKI